MINSIWQFERLPDTEDGLQRWKTAGLNQYGLPELGVHFLLKDGQEIIKAEALEILKRTTSASLEGIKVLDGQTIQGITIRGHHVFTFEAQLPDLTEYMQLVLSDDMGQYPWDPHCEPAYKKQITFNTDKAFYIVTQNKWQVNQLRKNLFAGVSAPDFKKRTEGYLAPVQYIVNNELFATGPRSIRSSLTSYINEVSWVCNLADITVICKDTDYSDPINKHFKAYKEKYLDR